jgi:hypothetical protein
MLCHVVPLKLTDVSEVVTTSIIRAMMMEAASTSETWVSFYKTTWHNIPHDSHLLACKKSSLRGGFPSSKEAMIFIILTP